MTEIHEHEINNQFLNGQGRKTFVRKPHYIDSKLFESWTTADFVVLSYARWRDTLLSFLVKLLQGFSLHLKQS